MTGNGTFMACTVYVKPWGEQYQSEKNINIFTSAIQLSETTRRRCNSMYNIWHYVHISISTDMKDVDHTSMAGTEMIT